MLALGGDCLADVSSLRAEPEVYGPVASDPTISRLLTALASDADKAERAIGTARRAARETAWDLAGHHAPGHGATAADPLVIDLDATLVTAHSEKEQARPTFKKGFGFHPLLAFADHGSAGGGEMLACLLRPGNAGSNTAADHATVIGNALDQAGVGGAAWEEGAHQDLMVPDRQKTTLQELVKRRVSVLCGIHPAHQHSRALPKLSPSTSGQPAYDPDMARPARGRGRRRADRADGSRAVGRRECGSSSAAKRPTPGAQLAVRGRRRVPADRVREPTPAVASWPISRSATAAEHVARTGSPRPQGHGPRRARPADALTEPDLVPDRRSGQRDHYLDGAALAHPEAPARRWEPKRLRHRLLQVPATFACHARARSRTVHLFGTARPGPRSSRPATPASAACPVPAWIDQQDTSPPTTLRTRPAGSPPIATTRGPSVTPSSQSPREHGQRRRHTPAHQLR